MDNNKEITWNELYALCNIDYEEVKRTPPKWTFEKFVDYLVMVKQNDEDVHPAYLYKNHNNFYTQLKRRERNGDIQVEEVYKASGLDYEKIVRQKRYRNKFSVVKKLSELRMNGSLHTLRATHIRKIDPALYKALLEYGNGSFEKGLEELAFNVADIHKVPEYKFIKPVYTRLRAMLGNKFQSIMSEAIKYTDLPIAHNNNKIDGKKPDMVYINGEKVWLEVKLTTKLVNSHLLSENPYHMRIERVIYIVFDESEPLSNPLPSNVEVLNAFTFIKNVKDLPKREWFKGRLFELLVDAENIGIEFTTTEHQKAIV
ncbi:hypothetical protein [Neobacillus sp. YIM B06451]|uniref:hypothetical protein n=1 Tax=Neobacillus sp. YIM B06451 TaxID=3070994 RepID=UPI00292D1FAD|nr:hypothetical protein [Neobacillus sp. YIM B06451]